MWLALSAAQVQWVYLNVGLSRDGLMSLKLWQLLSCGVLHGGKAHLAVNVLLLLLLGSKVEHISGRAGMLRVFVAGTLGGAVMHLCSSHFILVGASAGALALLLYLTTLSPESRLLMPFRVTGKNLGRGIIIASLLLLLLDPATMAPVLKDVGGRLVRHDMGWLFSISHASHLGGALAGWMLARWMLRPRVTLQQLQRDRARREESQF